jgi:uncharacterized protein
MAYMVRRWTSNGTRRKNALCLRERGFSFEDAVAAFADPNCLIELDDRVNYGEQRYRLMGEIDGRLHIVIFTMRGTKTRIISARKANPREQKHYHTRQTRR